MYPSSLPTGPYYPPLPQPALTPAQAYPSPFVSNSLPDITQNHIYQALAGLTPQQLGGQSVDQQAAQAAQNSQKQGPGGLGGAIGGAIIGGGIGSAFGPIGTLVGGIGGAAIGAFTPALELPQNAVVQTISDIENNKAGSIMNDIKNQILDQAPVPNYTQVFNKINPLPNVSPFSNIPILGAITNPHTLGNIGLSIVTNPFSFTPMPESSLAKIGSEDIANAGINDAVRSVIGNNATEANLTDAGGLLRNEIAKNLGAENFAKLSAESPELLSQFNEQFGAAVRSNPSAYISNTALTLPFGIPVMSQKFVNSISTNPTVASLNDALRYNPITSGVAQIFGKTIGQQQIERDATTATVAPNIENAAQSSLAVRGLENNMYEQKLLQAGTQFTQPELQDAVKQIEGVESVSANPEAVNFLKSQIQSLQNYAKDNGVQAPYEVEQYFPKTMALSQGSAQGALESLSQKLGFTPLLDKRVSSSSYLPGMNANISKEATIGKFIGEDGKTIIGDPKELGLANISTTETPRTVEGLPTKSIGTYKDVYGNIFNRVYLPVSEANKEFSATYGRNLYEENPLVALAAAHRDLTRKVAFNNFAENISPLLPNASPKLGGGFNKFEGVDPDLQKLGKAQFKGKIIPNSLQNFMQERFVSQPRETNELLNSLQGIGNISRRAMILNPIYHQLHNLMPNSMLGGANPFESLGIIGKGLIRPNKYLAELLNPETDAGKLAKLYTKSGGEIAGISNSLQGRNGIIDSLSRISPDSSKGLKAAFAKLDNGQKNMVMSADLGMRLNMFKNFIDRGLSGPEARQLTEKYLFNYGNMSNFEKTYLSNLFPFYQWMKANTMLWAKQPRAYAAWNGLLDGINEATAGHQRALNPQYKQGDLFLGNIGGQDVYLNPKLPFKDIQDLSLNPLNYLESRVNPAISTTAQLATNQDAFGNQIVNPNLPLSLQQKQILPGVSVDPRLAYALQNSLSPVASLASPQKTLSPLGILSAITGATTSQTKPNDQQLQEYEAQKAVMNALAQYELKQGNITSQQANPYNNSPGTQNMITRLQQQVQNLQDELYGYHYQNGKKIQGTGTYAAKHASYSSRRSASSLRRRLKSMQSYERRHVAVHMPHVRPIDSVIKIPRIKA